MEAGSTWSLLPKQSVSPREGSAERTVPTSGPNLSHAHQKKKNPLIIKDLQRICGNAYYENSAWISET